MSKQILAQTYIIRNFLMLEHFSKLTTWAKNQMTAKEFDVWMEGAAAKSKISKNVLFGNLLGTPKLRQGFDNALNNQIVKLDSFKLIPDALPSHVVNIIFSERINSLIDPTATGTRFGQDASKGGILQQAMKMQPFTGLVHYISGYWMTLDTINGGENEAENRAKLMGLLTRAADGEQTTFEDTTEELTNPADLIIIAPTPPSITGDTTTTDEESPPSNGGAATGNISSLGILGLIGAALFFMTRRR